MTTTLYTNARLIDPSQDLDALGHLLIRDEVVVACGKGNLKQNSKKPDKTIDIKGNILCPGLVDGRVFIGEPGAEHRETISSAGRAAAAGGITSLIMMPDTNPVIDDVSLVDFVRRAARDNTKINVYSSAALTKGLEGKEMTEIGLLSEAGAVAFTDGRKMVQNSLLMRRALTYAADFDALVVNDVQDPHLSASGVMNEGLTATHLGLPGIPVEAEIIPLERDLRLAALTGGRYHAASVSTAEAVEIIAIGKKKGLKVSAGASINHLTLNENDIGRYRTFFRMSPPLRAEEDRKALVEGLRSGAIDIIVSNHDPQDVDTKRLPFSDAANGAVGLETLLAAALRLHHTEEVPLLRLIDALSTRPANLFGLDAGSLAPGSQADFVVIDPDDLWILNESDLRSRSKNTPFEGARFQGRVLNTYVAGKLVFDLNDNRLN